MRGFDASVVAIVLEHRADDAGIDFLVLVLGLTELGPHVERELALVKVAGTGDARVEALRLADVFRAKVVDTTGAGDLLRIDRLVEFPDAVWVLDYKTGKRDGVDDSLLAAYQAQVGAYCTQVAKVFPTQRVQGLIIFAGGGSVSVPACV